MTFYKNSLFRFKHKNRALNKHIFAHAHTYAHHSLFIESEIMSKIYLNSLFDFILNHLSDLRPTYCTVLVCFKPFLFQRGDLRTQSDPPHNKQYACVCECEREREQYYFACHNHILILSHLHFLSLSKHFTVSNYIENLLRKHIVVLYFLCNDVMQR